MSSSPADVVAGGPATADVSPATVAGLVRRLAAQAPTERAREVARARIADTAIAIAVGTATDQGRRSAAVARALYGPGSVAARAYRMVAACRMTEIDDVDLLACVTPGACVVPAALAVLAMAPQTEPDRLLDVVVAGYEVALGLGEAIRGPRLLATGVWPSLVVGSVTAAAVTTLLLGGEEATLKRAVVLAAEQSIGGNARGSARESLLAGAVVAGIGAAMAVRAGFGVTGSQGGGVVGGLVLDTVEPGPAARIERPAVKGFCSARQAMGAVAAVRSIVSAHGLTAAEVDRIEVEVPHEYVAMVSRREVTDRRTSLSSAAYQLATALVRPERLDDVERADLGLDASLTALMETVTVRGDAGLSALYPQRWPASVRVHAGARVYEAEALDVPGEHDHSRSAIEAKAHRFLAGDPATADLIVASSWGVPTNPYRLAAALGGERISL